MKTRCLIVDDEPLAIKVIESHAAKIPSLEVVATCQNAIEAFDIMMKKKIDLVFLDVEMPGVTGLDLLKSLKKAPAIIITTAYRDFALDAFEFDAIDYLLKPIAFDRFFKSVSRYYQWQKSDTETMVIASEPEIDNDPYIFVRAERKIVKIPLKKILFIESLKDYIKIHLEDELVITKEKISHLEDKLPAALFIRTHRSFLVSTQHIKAFTAEIVEIGNREVPIGRTYKSAVLSFLGYQKL